MRILSFNFTKSITYFPCLFFVEMQHFWLISNTPNALLLQVGTMYHSAVGFIMQAHYHTHYCELWKLPGWSSLTIWHLNTDLCLYITLILQKHLNIHWKHGFNLFLSIFAKPQLLFQNHTLLYCYYFMYTHGWHHTTACMQQREFFSSFYCLFSKVLVFSILASGWFNEALTRISFSDHAFHKAVVLSPTLHSLALLL